MTHHELIMWACLATSGLSVVLGLVRLHAWSEDRHFAALRAECEALGILQAAKREACL